MLYNKAQELQEGIKLVNTEPLKQLLDKKMSRKDFLLHLGAFALSLTGITAIIRNLTSPHPTNRSVNSKTVTRRGFGGGSYGV